MKKTLAIVLALVMVLAMIPAMSAHATEFKTVTDKSYTLTFTSNNENGKEGAGVPYGVAKDATNSVTFEYKWSNLKADTTGRYTDDVKMGTLKITGWDEDLLSGKTTITGVTVDGKVLVETVKDDSSISFPVEITEAGYTDTFVVTVTGDMDLGDGKVKKVTETAKVSIVLKNTETKKAEKVATITNIASTDRDIMSAYIVGDKIYLDYVYGAVPAEVKITFGDEAGKAFAGKNWALQINGKNIWLPAGEVILKDSAAVYAVNGLADTKIKFTIDTAAANYITKEYAIVIREDIKEVDPKGIYFAETTKTIAMGEKYTPVVVGVATGKPVDAVLIEGEELFSGVVNDEVIDLINDDKTVIGTREGVAYITAAYATAGADKVYVTGSMKIVVTLPGESIPEVEPSAEIYYVTCRNLNVRAGAGTSFKKVDMIHRGDAVKVLEIKNGWAKVADGTYVCAKYIAK